MCGGVCVCACVCVCVCECRDVDKGMENLVHILALFLE